MTTETALTTQEVAVRFNELARQEKWFEIQDALFAENVSGTPATSGYYGYKRCKYPLRAGFLRERNE